MLNIIQTMLKIVNGLDCVTIRQKLAADRQSMVGDFT